MRACQGELEQHPDPARATTEPSQATFTDREMSRSSRRRRRRRRRRKRRRRRRRRQTHRHRLGHGHRHLLIPQAFIIEKIFLLLRSESVEEKKESSPRIQGNV
jgi:hypothetical protein